MVGGSHKLYYNTDLTNANVCFRFPVIKSVLQKGRTHLSHLSEFPVPPQCAVAEQLVSYIRPIQLELSVFMLRGGCC